MSDSRFPNSNEQPPTDDQSFLKYLRGFVASSLNAGKLHGRRITQVAPANGQVLTWNSTSNMWTFSSIGGVSGTIIIPKITSTPGSITVVNGVITAFINPT